MYKKKLKVLLSPKLKVSPMYFKKKWTIGPQRTGREVPSFVSFAAILKREDKDSTFHGLYRLYDENGTAIWVTEESRNIILRNKDTSANSGTDNDQNETDVGVAVAAAGVGNTNEYDMNAIQTDLLDEIKKHSEDLDEIKKRCEDLDEIKKHSEDLDEIKKSLSNLQISQTCRCSIQ